MTDRGSIRRFEVITTTPIKEPPMSPSVSTLLDPRPDVTTDIAARAVDATKTYGRGDTTVRALDHVTAEFPAVASPPSWARPARASRP